MTKRTHGVFGDALRAFYSLLLCGSHLFLLSFVIAGFGAFAQTKKEAVSAPASKKKADRGAEFFADRAIRIFQIDLPPDALMSLARDPKTYVRGTLREGSLVFTNVAIHLKGMGSFRPLDEKPSFVLNFDKFVPNRDYCGITRLALNNSVQDGTYVSEMLAAGLFRDAGVPAARVTHSRVMLNGRELGLYTAIEAMNKRFLSRFFKDNTGNLYEGYLQDVNQPLELDNGVDVSQRDLRALTVACQTINAKERFRNISQRLDADRFIAFAAMEMLIAHWDGYTLKANNYRCYHDPGTDKFVFIPHGMDAAFRRVNVPVTPPMRSVVSRALFQTEEGRQVYETTLRTLYTNVFRFNVITNRIEDALDKLRRGGLPAAQLAAIERQCSVMRDRIAQRIARVSDQLAGIPPVSLHFDASGLGKPDLWRDQDDRGEPKFARVKYDGRDVLHIRAASPNCRASWRSTFFLPPGRYRFEGRLRIAGIPAAGYADLRVSGDTRSTRINGTSAWQQMQHPFIVNEEGGTDVELVCELNSPSGEVWFDLESLCVRRLVPGAGR